MTIDGLETLWTGLVHTGQSEYEFIRIGGTCIPELNVGFSLDLQRCLILELPKNMPGNWPNIEKDNLSLSWYPDTGYIVVRLLDAGYNDLFNDLILSIYRNIAGLVVPADYTAGLIRTFNRWSGFFDDRQGRRMQPEVLRGLLGELIVLRDMLSAAGFDTVNNILRSWRGPYDEVRDFIGDQCDTEVKTTDGNSDIHISSEFQLMPEAAKELQLAVVNLEPDFNSGFSLRSLLGELRTKIDNQAGDTSILLDALFQKGLTYRNLSEYDNLRYRAHRIIFYNCQQPGFPALVRSSLPPAAYQISYRLRLTQLGNFISDIKEL